MRRALLLLLLLAVAAGAWLVDTLHAAGYWREIEPHFSGSCRAVGGMPGPEDLTIHPRTGIAYVSSTDRRAVADGRPARGAIFGLDLAATAPAPVNLTPDADPDFAPHGLSLWVAPDGNDRLFVINHQDGRHTIEEFEIRAERLAHVRTLSDPLLRSPNDLVAVGPDRVYVTNDHRWPRGVMRTLEEWLRLPASDVIEWDGRSFRVAATGIRLSNGINASRDGGTVFVASPTGREVRAYARDAESGALALRERIDLGTAPDNVEVDDDGALWVGAHPKLLALVAHGKGAPEHSPSQVVRASPRPGGGWAVEEVFLDPGERQCASSVAAVRGDRLLIGGIFEDHVLDCTR
jgi:arylesterase/paraoxonase